MPHAAPAARGVYRPRRPQAFGPDPKGPRERVRRELTRTMPGDGFVFVRPLPEVVHDPRRTWHLGATRFALGARPSLVVRMVVGQGVRSTAIGVTISRVLAWAASRAVEPLLYKQSATDVPTEALRAD